MQLSEEDVRTELCRALLGVGQYRLCKSYLQGLSAEAAEQLVLAAGKEVYLSASGMADKAVKQVGEGDPAVAAAASCTVVQTQLFALNFLLRCVPSEWPQPVSSLIPWHPFCCCRPRSAWPWHPPLRQPRSSWRASRRQSSCRSWGWTCRRCSCSSCGRARPGATALCWSRQAAAAAAAAASATAASNATLSAQIYSLPGLLAP